MAKFDELVQTAQDLQSAVSNLATVIADETAAIQAVIDQLNQQNDAALAPVVASLQASLANLGGATQAVADIVP